MSLEFVSTMSLEFCVNYVLDWFTCLALYLRDFDPEPTLK